MAHPRQFVTQSVGLFAALRSNPRARSLGLYSLALAICLIVLGTVLDVRSDARSRPYFYRGDTMFYHVLAKSVTEQGWFLDVPQLGAPGSLNLRDVPTSDNNLHILILWILGRTTSPYPAAINGFFLLSFPLVFLSALGVMRHFGVAWWAAVWASLLYTFAPFHFARGEHHLFLASYWPVPLAVLMMLWVSRDTLTPRPAGPAAGWKFPLALVICLVLASTGFYYAFFACFFLAVASSIAAVRRRSWRGLWPGLGLVVVIGAGVAVNLSPSLLRFQEQGTVPAVRRLAGDADRFGLRIAQVLLPVSGHRLGALGDLKFDYNRRPLVNENDHSSIGIAGSLGFLGLLWWVFFRKPAADGLGEPGAAGLLHHLSVFNLAGLLFGTIGGFGSLVAFFGLPQVRAYNRISVFLCFFALFAAAAWLDGLFRGLATTRVRKMAMGCALAIGTALALFDQISPNALPDYKRSRAQFMSDAAFVRQIEQRVPRGARIFQLPFMTFPESPPVVRMMDYDMLRGYLHSTHLRWSYGTISGREGNAWLRQTASKPLDELVDAVAWAGFSGIYIDRNGFADRGAQIETELLKLPGDPPIHSPDEQLVFYGLAGHRARLERRTPQGEWEARREAALYPPLAVWQRGFSDQECAECGRWGGSSGQMKLVNRAERVQHVRLEMTVTPNGDGKVTVQTPLFGEHLKVDGNSRRVVKTFALPPGEHQVRFASDARRVYPPDDFRDMVFLVQAFSLTSVQASAPAEAPPAVSVRPPVDGSGTPSEAGDGPRGPSSASDSARPRS